ncbi:MAG: transposase, partial [Candidatus Methanomethylophilaceae archaeon]|nr:transposase [Candidatus Methanomethylophilaceae archaeon]
MDPTMAKKDVGIDLGLENMVTMSDGTVIPNDRTYRKKERELANAQRLLSECEKGTPEYYKRLGKLSHKYKKTRNHRKDMFHKISRELSVRYGNIAMEDLSVKEMAE